MSPRVEDRRGDPKGATRLTKDGNIYGDQTFRPPFELNKGAYRPADVLPYNDPEAAFNTLTEEQQKAYRDYFHKAANDAPRSARTLAAGRRKQRYPIAAGR